MRALIRLREMIEAEEPVDAFVRTNRTDLLDLLAGVACQTPTFPDVDFNNRMVGGVYLEPRIWVLFEALVDRCDRITRLDHLLAVSAAERERRRMRESECEKVLLRVNIHKLRGLLPKGWRIKAVWAAGYILKREIR